MFCPNCGIEYRPGFTHCNDCDVDLVEQLPGAETGPEDGSAGGDEVELLWRGTNGRVFSEIASSLEDAGIRFNRENLDARLTFGNSYSALEIWVPGPELDAAKKVLDDALARIAAPVAASAGEAAEQADAEDGEWTEPSGAVEDPHPEDATAEVWRGEDFEFAGFLKSALAGNGIGSYLADEEGQPLVLRVLPEDTQRAAPIIRQVVEGTLPE